MASQTFCVLLSWTCWHIEFPHTQRHVGRKILPRSIKQLPWKTRCTRSDENRSISHRKQTYHFISATALTWSVTTFKPHCLMCPSGKIQIDADGWSHSYHGPGGTDWRQEPLPPAPHRCLMQSTHSSCCQCPVCEGSCGVKRQLRLPEREVLLPTLAWSEKYGLSQLNLPLSI